MIFSTNGTLSLLLSHNMLGRLHKVLLVQIPSINSLMYHLCIIGKYGSIASVLKIDTKFLNICRKFLFVLHCIRLYQTEILDILPLFIRISIIRVFQLNFFYCFVIKRRTCRCSGTESICTIGPLSWYK